MVIYYSKINLITDHVFKIYENREELRKILSILLGDLSSGIFYDQEEDQVEGDGNIVKNRTRYNLVIREKTDEYIYGVVHKRSRIYYKDINPIDGEIISQSVKSIEAIVFYFDVFKETIGFYTTKRFGYQEFNQAFCNIINTCLERNKRQFRFGIALRTEGLDIGEIIEQLGQINKIRELKLKFQPPNPDQELLDSIQESGEKFVSEMADANVTGMSVVFNSKGSSGLNIESKMIKENLEDIKNLTYMVDDKKAIGKGYISVEAVGADGKKYTTADKRPLKTVIEKAEEFKEACKAAIKAIV